MPDDGQAVRQVLNEEQRDLLAHERLIANGTSNLEHNENGEEFSPMSPEYFLDREPRRRTNFCRLFLVGGAILIACVGIAELIDERHPEPFSGTRRQPQFIGHSVLAAMDRSADPCNNFYEYACGSWLRKQTIPPDRISYSRSFSHVYDTIRKELRTLLKVDLQHRHHPNAIAGRLYTSCMRGIASGPLNVHPLKPFIQRFNKFTDSQSFAELLGTLHYALSAGMFGTYVGVDDKHPTQYGLFFSQGGLGLKPPKKYTSTKEDDVKIREAYVKLIKDHLIAAAKGRLIPQDGLDELAPRVFAFEKKLASYHKAPEERRNPEKLYNPKNISDLPASLHFRKYLKVINVDPGKANNIVILDNVKYANEIAAMMSSVETDKKTLEAAKGYLAYHLLRYFAGSGILGEELYMKNFAFRTLQTGVKKLPEKWKRCQSVVTSFLGDALGEAFIHKHFPKGQKDYAQRLAEEITKSFGISLSRQDWMDEATRRAAKEKLSNIFWKLGYTRKFDKYPGLKITKHHFADNVMNAGKYSFDFQASRLGKPVDKTEWSMNAFEVNAYYSPARNEMVFPAGILQQPFFSDAFPDAMNYGSIGSVIGHEMSHGFDDSGRKYDKTGRLVSWWSDESAKRYVGKTKCFIDLFNGYKPRSVDIYVKGNLTLGENLADTNGVKVAYQAFKSFMNNSDVTARSSNPVLASELTNHQLFFVSYAQTWCTKYRMKSLELQMLTDPHSPGQFRVQGPLSQNEDFGKVFNCKVGTVYNPEKKCALW